MRRNALKERKADIRNKIQLGGLVIKAGLDDEVSAVILGALVEAMVALAGDDAELARRRFRRIGDRTFKEDEKNNHDAE
jgi:hypothetical protein